VESRVIAFQSLHFHFLVVSFLFSPSHSPMCPTLGMLNLDMVVRKSVSSFWGLLEVNGFGSGHV
jgi:hypothetical protein